MIDMSTWPELVVDVVDDLQLDPNNVRLELSEGVTESDIVQDLFSNEKVLTLVDGIAKVGYLTHEVPIVVRRKSGLTVVEGNRRVAALKAIQNPYLASQFQSQVTRIAMSITNRDELKKM
jgi:ParB-like chromosome segregation protein Spo0J